MIYYGTDDEIILEHTIKYEIQMLESYVQGIPVWLSNIHDILLPYLLTVIFIFENRILSQMVTIH